MGARQRIRLRNQTVCHAARWFLTQTGYRNAIKCLPGTVKFTFPHHLDTEKNPSLVSFAISNCNLQRTLKEFNSAVRQGSHGRGKKSHVIQLFLTAFHSIGIQTKLTIISYFSSKVISSTTAPEQPLCTLCCRSCSSHRQLLLVPGEKDPSSSKKNGLWVTVCCVQNGHWSAQ